MYAMETLLQKDGVLTTPTRHQDSQLSAQSQAGEQEDDLGEDFNEN